jgi:hypothetical protein
LARCAVPVLPATRKPVDLRQRGGAARADDGLEHVARVLAVDSLSTLVRSGAGGASPPTDETSRGSTRTPSLAIAW